VVTHFARASGRADRAGLVARLFGILIGVVATPAFAQVAGGAKAEPWIRDQLGTPPPAVDGEPGRAFPWKNVVSPGADAQVTKAQAVAWEQQLRAVADYLSAQPVLPWT
jgi:hypothetical protein